MSVQKYQFIFDGFFPPLTEHIHDNYNVEFENACVYQIWQPIEDKSMLPISCLNYQFFSLCVIWSSRSSYKTAMTWSDKLLLVLVKGKSRGQDLLHLGVVMLRHHGWLQWFKTFLANSSSWRPDFIILYMELEGKLFIRRGEGVKSLYEIENLIS